ncbi:hypothetical protein SUGI_0294230 [Cryptomeria japonica]|nr:hypothetical protein SUGI_0294230 [Cryptomeria japonica]
MQNRESLQNVTCWIGHDVLLLLLLYALYFLVRNLVFAGNPNDTLKRNSLGNSKRALFRSASTSTGY